MSDANSTRRAWLKPALAGVAVGAVLAGGPIGLYAVQLDSRLKASTADFAQNNARLAQIQSQLDAAHAQLQSQQQLSRELAKPDLPLQLSFRKGFFDAGIVLTVRNVSRDQVAVIADFGGAAGGSQSRRIVIPANGAREVGESEGWAFTSGDSVTLKHADYRDLTQTVPSL